MTLIEVIVAFALFAVMSTSVVVLVSSAARSTGEDTRRVVANQLATRELEIVRDAFESAVRGPDTVSKNQQLNANPLPGGTAGQPLVVDGVSYTVRRVMRPVPIGGAAETPCDEASGSELQYYEVQVEVTWPGLGDRPPVTMNTIVTPRKGTYSEQDGHIGIRVIDAAGEPRGSVPVSARQTVGPTVGATSGGSTAPDGCVLLGQLTAGTYEVSVTQPNHVDRAGNPTAKLTATVLAKQLWRNVIEYDEAARIDVTLSPTHPDYGVPSGPFPITLANSGLTPSGIRTIDGSGASRSLTGLWPFPSGYQVWAGRCLANNPGDAVAPPVASDPGGVASTTVDLAPVRVRANAGTSLKAVIKSETACSSDTARTITLGTVPSSGVLRTSLPYGVWQFGKNVTGAQLSASVTLTPSSTAPTEATIPEVRVS